ncbi:MAG: class I SAM-dependent methyltransferase [Saprospiraceae bacterium]
MNLKLLFPVYRSRYKWIEKTLEKYALTAGGYERALSLGCGEGEGDPVIAQHTKQLIACDINADDISHAQATNQRFTNINYVVADATALIFPENHFDLVVCSEVIEHIGEPADRILQEIYRVLKPDKIAILTFPSRSFPFSYDPINRISSMLGRERLVPWGAYAFGHDYLIDVNDFKNWCQKYQLEIIEDVSLSGYLVGFLEMYWTGLLQSIFKKNASNLAETDRNKSISYRPAFGDPLVGKLTELILWLDKKLFLKKDHSILKAFVLKKKL